MNPTRSQRGSGFVELLAAVGVLSVVVIGLSPTLLSTRKAADLSKNQSIATSLAEDKIEQIRTQAGVTNGSDGPLKADGTSGGIFSRAWTVTSNTPVSGVNEVVVTVSWRDRPSNSSVSIVTLVTP